MQFNGFPQEGLNFLADLAANNNKSWFSANKDRYQTYLLGPAQAFVMELGQRLQTLSESVQFDTRTNGSGTLMRIYRDTRFSQDKTPYKTNISGLFWEGEGKKTECPAFGFQLTVDGMGLMAGMFGFSKELLQAYREAVDNEEFGAELGVVLAAIRERTGYSVIGEYYKRVPRGFNPNHPRADLLRYNGLYVHPNPSLTLADVMSPSLVDRCYRHFEFMAPVQQWLLKLF